MISHHFQAWYDHFYPKEPNYHGIYNGINLQGMDIARLYLELRRNPSLTIPEFLDAEETFYKVTVPRSGYFRAAEIVIRGWSKATRTRKQFRGKSLSTGPGCR